MVKQFLMASVLVSSFLAVGCSGGEDTSGDIPTKAGAMNNTPEAKAAKEAPPQTDAPPPGGPRKGAGGGMAFDPNAPRPKAEGGVGEN